MNKHATVPHKYQNLSKPFLTLFLTFRQPTDERTKSFQRETIRRVGGRKRTRNDESFGDMIKTLVLLFAACHAPLGFQPGSTPKFPFLKDVAKNSYSRTKRFVGFGTTGCWDGQWTCN